MTALPASTDFTNSSVTEAMFKTAISNQRDFLAGLFGSDGLNTTALAALGAIFNSLEVKTANHNITLIDRGKIFQCNGTITISLDPASTLGSAFSFIISNTGIGVVTLNPSGSELIDGELTKEINEGESIIIYCNGTNYFSIGGGGSGGSRSEIFTTNGTWLQPAGVKNAQVICIGGGGGGTTNGALYGGYGGAIWASVIDIDGDVAITVGAGGSGGGGSGGSSSFGSYVTATGGAGATSTSNGANGVGSTSHRIIRNRAEHVALFEGLDIRTIFNGAAGNPLQWSVTSEFKPGARGQSGNSNANFTTGGVSGAVLVIF